MPTAEPVRLLVRGTCDDLGEVWLLDYLTLERFSTDAVTVTCEPIYAMLTAVPVPEPGATWLLLAGVLLLALLSERRMRSE